MSDSLPLRGPSRGRRSDRIEIRGLRVTGTHGVLREEQERGQPFEIDFDIHMDLRPASESDALEDTADYGAVSDAVAAVVAGPHAQLLEHLAQLIATAIFEAAPAATGVSVTIRKLRPPVPHDMAFAAVTIHRRRDDRDPGDQGS